jgi:hypothetical protein
MKDSSESGNVLAAVLARAIEAGADELKVEYKDGEEWVLAVNGGVGFVICSIPSSNKEAAELREELSAIAEKHRKKGRTVEVSGEIYQIRVSVFDSFGEDAFRVWFRHANLSRQDN